MAARLEPGETVRVVGRPSVKEQYWGMSGVVLRRYGTGSPEVRRRVVVRTHGVRPIELIVDARNLERIDG